MKLKNTGFTLIELLVVVAILGILMALIVPKFSKIIGEAKEHKCRNNLRQLQSAVINYMNDNGGNLPYAMSYEVFDPAGQKYYERRGWITWFNTSLDIDKLNSLWSGDGADESHEKDLSDDQGTGEKARFGVENGTIFPYLNNSLEPYVCPVMKAEKVNRVTNKPTTIYRTYAMNPFFKSPGNRSWWPVKASRIGTAEYYGGRTPESAKLLLFAEIVPSEKENEDISRSSSMDPHNQGDCCITPDKDTAGSDFIAYDSVKNTYGIHNSPVRGTQASLAVFFDGHIEKVFSKTDKKGLNTAWYYNRGLDPKLADDGI